MKQTRKKILNMDFIQNTKTNSDFNIILFSTQTKITVFHRYQMLIIFIFIPGKQNTTLFHKEHSFRNTAQQ